MDLGDLHQACLSLLSNLYRLAGLNLDMPRLGSRLGHKTSKDPEMRQLC